MFADRRRHAAGPARELALDCLAAGIEAARPDRLVRDQLSFDDDHLRLGETTYDLSTFERVLVVGGGKGAGELAVALEGLLGDCLDGGVVVTTDRVDADRVAIRTGDHPEPTDRNATATAELCEMVADADEETLVLVVVTGGASALCCAPVEGLDVADLRQTTESLLASGATIDELNAVRKHCSAIKGGRLARLAAPGTVLTLTISDVVGDDPTVIGSGPTVSDPTTFDDALAVVERYELADAISTSVLEHLHRGAAGDRAETPTGGEPALAAAHWELLANGRTAIEAARRVATERGYNPAVLSGRLRGEAREAGRFHAAVAAEAAERGEPVEPPAVVLSGGEVTATVRGEGTGGPNQELALAAALELADLDGGYGKSSDIVLASVDTDGIDGPTDAAGAIVDASTVVSDRAAARAAIGRSDAGGFLEARDALLQTGYTGTNVNDLRVIVIDRPERH